MMLPMGRTRSAAGASNRRALVSSASALLVLVVGAACGDSSGPPEVASVAISPSPASVRVGGTQQLEATARDGSGGTITGRLATWSSSNSTIVQVSTTGLLTGGQPGTATVTAMIDAVPGTVNVTVLPPQATITSITPSPLVAGGTATIQGTGFSPVNASNIVTVGGFPATVTAASATSLTATLSSATCLPSGNTTVRVQAAGNDPGEFVHPFQSNVPLFTPPPIGQQVLITNVANFCLQLGASSAVETYVIGVQSVSEAASSLTPAVVRGAVPAVAAVAPALIAPSFQNTPQFSALLRSRAVQRRIRHQQAELALRAHDRQLFMTARSTSSSAGLFAARTALAAMPVPGTSQVGDTVDVKVPDRTSPTTLCANADTITTVVRYAGQHAFIVEDTANPEGGFTAADYQTLGALFDDQIWNTDTSYFGQPSDIDGNSRIVMVVTREINQNRNILGFVSSADLRPSDPQCPASNNGEYYYGIAPDPTGTHEFGEFTLEEARGLWPILMAHEFTHIIQLSQRLALPQPTFPTVWELEGQATLAEEVVGHAVTGRSPGSNYGSEVALSFDAGGRRWYIAPFIDMLLFAGWAGDSIATRITGAPEQCTWLTTTEANVGPCIGGRGAYGVSWSFLRWLSDHFGPTFPGGEQGLHRALIANTSVGFANIVGRVGGSIDQLLAQWAASLYVDDRDLVVFDPRLTMLSWDLFQINELSIAGNPAARPLGFRPYTRSFSDFSVPISVRGGSTAYFRVGGVRPATAISVTSTSAAALPTTFRVWVVGVQ